jgi:aryl sulfotransferase
LRAYFINWLLCDGYPFWSFWDNVGSWWAIRHLPNVLFLHYSDLKADLPREVRRIARFLDIDPDPATLDAVVAHSSFDYMKANAALCAPRGGKFFEGGARTFIHKGTNGRWRDTLTSADCRSYETLAEEWLGPACARWLAEGGPTDPHAAAFAAACAA